MVHVSLLAVAVLIGVPLAEPLGEVEKADALATIAQMKTSRRGPYAGISWFCNDGTVLPPKPYACVEHGGGLQYGVLSREARKLGQWGIHVGTVLASLPPAALAENDYYRARAFIVEAYLERALGGWVLTEAKGYRGFRQAEDEEEAARQHLIELAQRPDLLQKNRNLYVRLMRAMPYGQQGELADEVRTLAGLLGDADKDFAYLRFKIHAMPEPGDIGAVESYCASKTGELRELGLELVKKLKDFYDPAARVERLRNVRTWIWDRDCKEAIQNFIDTPLSEPLDVLNKGLELMKLAHSLIQPGSGSKRGERNLLLLHTMSLVESLWVNLTSPFSRMDMSRRQTLEVAEKLITAAGVLGILSRREVASAVEGAVLARTGEPQNYAAGVERMGRVLEWARARHLADLGLALPRYQSVEPRARAVVDDILRSGVMLPLAAVLDRLTADVERMRGGGHHLVGLAGDGKTALRGENPGMALGPLAVLELGGDVSKLKRNQIALLRELPPELPPVAGIITVGPAGSLSHVSLLARNLGIPHAAVGGETAEELAALAGSDVVLGVSAERRVMLGPVHALSEDEKKALARPHVDDEPFLQIDHHILDLTTQHILTLDQVSPGDSGRRVGPKAAELGRLRKLFPERVSDAAVLPFGMFVKHVDRDGPNGEPSPLAKLRDAYAAARGKPLSEVEAPLLAALAEFREAIGTLPFPEGFEREVRAALERLGKLGTFGVFVRSDTNVEDLKAFTGAGLNKTIANRTRLASVLAAIREVWASPYTERSFRWRQRILKNPEYVFPSVILHKTVPSEMSGVMVTTDLENLTPNALTVSVSEGVAAVVDGGAPETVVIGNNQGLRLLSSSRTATRKRIPAAPREGVIVSSAEGRDPLLGNPELEELRRLAAEVKQQIPPEDGLPWDIEFGFYKGKAWLMQIRPLRTSTHAATHPLLVKLDEATGLPQSTLDLTELVP